MDFKLQNAEINRLRFGFDGATVSMGFPADTKLEAVACSLDTLVPHDDAPIAIDATLAAP
jgi:hypothetical protein